MADVEQIDPFEQQAKLCRALANATRLRLLHELSTGERSAGELRETLEISRVLLSQHMSVSRRSGLFGSARRGCESSIGSRSRSSRRRAIWSARPWSV